MIGNKIAVLIYGQSRFLENPHSLLSLRALFPNHQLDFYIHTWKDLNIGNQESLIQEKYMPLALKIDDPLDQHVELEKYKDSIFECKSRLKIEKQDAYIFSCISQLASVQAVNELFCNHIAENDGTYAYVVLTRFDAIYLGKFNSKLLDTFDLIVSKSHSYYPDVIQIYRTRIARKIRPIEVLPLSFQGCWDLCGESLRETSHRLKGISISYDGFYYHLTREGMSVGQKLKLIWQYFRYIYKKLCCNELIYNDRSQ